MSFTQISHAKAPRTSHVIISRNSFSIALPRILVEENRTVHSTSQGDISTSSFTLTIQSFTPSSARLVH